MNGLLSLVWELLNSTSCLDIALVWRGPIFSRTFKKKPVTLGSYIPSPTIIKFLLQTRGRERRREKPTDVRDSKVEDRGQGLVTWASNRHASPFLPLQLNALTLQCFVLQWHFTFQLGNSLSRFCIAEAMCSSIHHYLYPLAILLLNALNEKALQETFLYNSGCTELMFISPWASISDGNFVLTRISAEDNFASTKCRSWSLK